MKLMIYNFDYMKVYITSSNICMNDSSVFTKDISYNDNIL